jgi:poly(hydroxyalkanoate) depolymerase family esterase
MANEDGTSAREYLLYRPARLAPEHKRALVVFLHGCTQTATEAMEGTGWNALADERGFVIAYPEQSTGADGNGARCWNSGQAPVYPRGVHELETIARITRAVRDEHRVPVGRVFIAGLSSGGLMSAAMAATYPDLYAALGSVIACGYPCGDPTGVAAHNRMAEHAQVVPGFFVAGSADYLINVASSQGGARGWAAANDLADDGESNGSVSTEPESEQRGFEQQPTPGTDLCVRNYNNPCPAGALGFQEYPTTIDRFRAADGAVIVESWLLHGMSHSYPGGARDQGTYTDPYGPSINVPMYEFFLASAR